MKNIILIVVLLAIVAIAGLYVYRAMKKGKKCIGCPEGCSCANKNGACKR